MIIIIKVLAMTMIMSFLFSIFIYSLNISIEILFGAFLLSRCNVLISFNVFWYFHWNVFMLSIFSLFPFLSVNWIISKIRLSFGEYYLYNKNYVSIKFWKAKVNINEKFYYRNYICKNVLMLRLWFEKT